MLLTKEAHHQRVGILLQMLHVSLQVGQEEVRFSFTLGLQEVAFIIPVRVQWVQLKLNNLRSKTLR